MKILITGANGFIGKNLCACLEGRGYGGLLKYDMPANERLLEQYAAACDFVMHLAGVNRPADEAGFEENHLFTARLLEALRESPRRVPVLLASSAQAALDNPYGRSKRKAEDLVFEYGRQTGAHVYVFRLPGVFGKWCAPNYNSVVATFCHNIARSLPVRVDDPAAEISLVYIDDVVRAFIDTTEEKALQQEQYCRAEPVYRVTVGELAEMIQGFRDSRETLGVAAEDGLSRKLCSTYLSYLPEDAFSYELRALKDDRGIFAECFKSASGGQISVNIAKPGATKGGHWHQTKTEKIIVLKGTGVMRFQKLGTGKVLLYPVSSEKLEVVDIPPGYVHDVTNTGDDDLIMVIWANQIFDPANPDTYPKKIEGLS